MKNNEPAANSIKISPCPIYAIITVFPMLLLVVAITIIAKKFFPLLIVLSLILLFVICYKYLYLRFTVYSINKEVLKIKTGILSKRVDSLELYRVKDYVVTQSFVMRMFKIMTITLYTKDLTSGKVSLMGIPVSDLPDIIRDNVQQARLKNKIFEIN